MNKKNLYQINKLHIKELGGYIGNEFNLHYFVEWIHIRLLMRDSRH